MEKTTITLDTDTANKLRRFKIMCRARDLNDVIKMLIRTYYAYQRSLK